MNGTSQMLVYLIAIPLFSAAFLLLGGRALDKVGHIVGTLASLAAFVVGLLEFVAMLGRAPENRAVTQPLFTWIEVGNFNVGATLFLDQLSMCFVLLITGVGTLIHIYSIAYMSHDRDRRRFFAFLNLFIAAMLLLVLGDSYLSLYVGWEGVGLASYLLIGFWNQKPAYATAAKKAFVANRVGDVGLSLAVMIAFVQFGSVSFSGVAEGVEAGKASSLALNCLGAALLLAAVGKSAQFPLQSWLGDAMAGPTPVSALIHAATMVTAGVYLISRSHFVFDVASVAQTLVVIVGAITLLFGAIIGMAKDDIKKALAASTMSQIGYMILATGLGPVGYAFAMMHLLTHGFFKAGMFLGAGSVMHGMNDEVDMRKYGALRKYMPVTFITFGLGYLAIIGVPPFAGFYSKDKIIEIALDAGGAKGIILGGITLLGAAITAFYMSRVMLMTFFGNKRWDSGAHPHESPALMTIPMAILAIGSVSAGFIFTMGDRFVKFLEPVFHSEHGGGHGEEEHFLSPIVVSGLALAAVAIGVSIAIAKYGRGKEIPTVAPSDVTIWTKVARRDLLQDEINETLFMRPGQELTKALAIVDEKVIDGAVRGVGSLTLDVASGVRKTQTGFVRSYALWIIVGALAILAAITLVTL
ncbi:MAG: NADH-quinone oxidoreductase subunit L [Actinobacteria bacterium]|uniref:NADH-quinone oxidoreductase subunit L n=1 Tax=Candidatus Fonsibacter lacus TaxID=2576439 RepID=A0A965LL49_9PROT|nr:NADH-quinone oxidoreductase subunit L [Candidatus Fonsibacter lacus]